MAFKYASHLSKKGETPQTQVIPGREAEMSPNTAGGFAFDIDDWGRFDRFLVLGTEGGTYYASEHDLTLENVEGVMRCIAADGVRAVARIVDVSDGGRAPKNDGAIFALALAAKRGDDVTRAEANAALPKVCRTGTHLFQFAAYIDHLGGWGRGSRNAVARWYTEKAADSLAFQLVKYRQREGWSHADLLRLAHPKPPDAIAPLLAFAARKPHSAPMPRVIEGYLCAQSASAPEESARLVAEYNLPRECVKTEHLGEPLVLEALLPTMPFTALIRNLGNLTKAGVLAPFSEAETLILRKLSDVEGLLRARVHPMSVFLALRTYSSGHGIRGSGAWTPVQRVVDALDAAFYAALANVTPTNRRILLAVDVSGSMMSGVAGAPVTAAETAAAMGLIVARTEPSHLFVGINTGPVELRISPTMRLDAAMETVRNTLGGGTDLSVPARWLATEKIAVDAVVILTDSETWAGRGQHPSEAMSTYRRQVNLPVRNVVAATTATGHSIGDTADPLTLQCAGLDATTPEVIRGFVAEEF